MSTPATAHPATDIVGAGLIGRHPKGLYLLFATEMWERFSYYGMRALLVLYLVNQTSGGLGWTTERALGLYGWYTGLVYLTPLIGGMIADRYLGQRKTLVIGGVLMMIGHFSLALPGMAAFYAGLAFLIAGNGMFKPNISTMVGELYPQGDARRDGAFTIFYMGINVGAFFGSLICGYLGEVVNWHLGFGAAGVGMGLGLISFLALNKKLLGHVGLAPKERKRLSAVEKAERERPLTTIDYHRLVVIGVLLVFVVAFWTAFEQAGGLMNIFTAQDVDRTLFGWEVPTTWFQTLNSLFIVLLAPVFSVLWERLGDKGKDPNPALKMALGILFTSLGFVVLWFAAKQAEGPAKTAQFFIIATYFLHTVGELCISPVGLSMVTKLAPVKLVGFAMGAWFLSNFLGNKMAGVIGGMSQNLGAVTVFGWIAVGTAMVGAVLLVVNGLLYRWMHGATENAAPPPAPSSVVPSPGV